MALVNKKPFPDQLFDENTSDESSSEGRHSAAGESSLTSGSTDRQPKQKKNTVTFAGVHDEPSEGESEHESIENPASVPSGIRDINDHEIFLQNDLSAAGVVDETSTRVTFVQVMQTPVLAVRVITMMLIWLVTTLVYYGLSMNSTDLGSDAYSYNKPYMNFILTALVEFPGYTLALALQMTVGRRHGLGFSLLLAGLSCIGAGIVLREYQNVFHFFSDRHYYYYYY